MSHRIVPCLLTLLVASWASPLYAQQANPESEAVERAEPVRIIGTTPIQGIGLPVEQVPYNVQIIGIEELERSLETSLSGYLTRQAAGIVINEAQTTPLQPDIYYRGFVASPLLGLPQGLSVYQNGVRINEAFGDTVNWDLIPESAIDSVNLVGGSNPLFGLNTLGGAISIKTKTGFSDDDHDLELLGGQHGTFSGQFESGGNNGRVGYFVTGNYQSENGWRDASPSQVRSLFASIGTRNRIGTAVDVNVTHANTDLTGNGPAPPELWETEDRESIFTSPDITENKLIFVDVQASQWFGDVAQLSGNTFFRRNNTDSFNGDASPFEKCEVGGEEVLCPEDEDDAPILDRDGNAIAAELDVGGATRELDAINNESRREQYSFGGALQGAYLRSLAGRDNQLLVGLSYFEGRTDFRSSVEVGYLDENRASVGAGVFVPAEGRALRVETYTWSAYATDTYAVTPWLSLTLSGRYNRTRVELADRGGEYGLTEANPDLNGRHSFHRFNPAGGLAFILTPQVSAYLNYGESSRAPTPVELSCADPDDECRLPNAFLADPPLKQVVSRSGEAGLRGNHRNWSWSIGGYYTRNEDDIIFQSTGGASGNLGFFANVGDTQRIGGDASLAFRAGWLDGTASYSFVRATYEDPFPIRDLLGEDGEDLTVRSGNRIPGIPQIAIKGTLGATFLANRSRLALEGEYYSDRNYRGDEANQLRPVSNYGLVHLLFNYRPSSIFSFFVRVNNLLDREYETFGLLGEPDEVAEVLGTGDDDGEDDFSGRFLSPGAPRTVIGGIRVRF